MPGDQTMEMLEELGGFVGVRPLIAAVMSEADAREIAHPMP